MTLLSSGLMGNRAFLKLWIGNGISVLGDGMYDLALAWSIYRLTGSSLALGSLWTQDTILRIAMGSISGTVADRYDRRTIMIASDLIRACALVGLFGLTSFGSFHPAYLFIVGALLSVGGSFFSPAFGAALPSIVTSHDLVPANSLFLLSRRSMSLVAPALSGLLVMWWGEKAVFLIDGITFLVSAGLVSTVRRIPADVQTKHESFSTSLGQGLQFITSPGPVRSTLSAAAIVNLLGAVADIALPVYLLGGMGLSAAQFGSIRTAQAAGAIAGAMVASQIVERMGLHRTYTCGIVASGACVAILAAAGRTEFILPTVLVQAAILVSVNVSMSTWLQSEVPDSLRGRVFGVLGSVFPALEPVGTMVGSAIASLWAPRLLIACAGVSQVVFGSRYGRLGTTRSADTARAST